MELDKVKERIYSIDFLRGVVMIIMLLDHTRDFVHHNALLTDPTDMSSTTVPLFFTRWITHYCAPIFVFLSGVSIYLQKMYGKSNGELARFLVTRGLWLIVLEFTVIRTLIVFNLDYSLVGFAQVIWVIGVSMIVMAALIYLPLRIVGLFGVAMILLHNLLDVYRILPGEAFNPDASLGQMVWMVLHQQGLVSLFGGPVIVVLYPLVPWIGVMAAGYALGAIYQWDGERRKKFLLAVGIAATVLFVVVRATNFYGDPSPWMNSAEFAAAQAANPRPGPAPAEPGRLLTEPAFSVLSFLNTTKYPPSLLFLLMTLGPGLIVLGLTDRISGEGILQWIAIIFGRVPLFFYVLQWLSAHFFGIAFSLLAGKDIGYFFQGPGPGTQLPPDNGFSLPVVYLAWIGGLIILFPLCYWYGEYKRKSKHWLLSYL